MKPNALLLVLGVSLFTLNANAHSRLKASAEVAARSTNAGVKTGPCGGFPRAASPPMLNAGSTLIVTWEETINHPGRFEFYISQSGDQNFTLVKTVEDTQNGTGDLPHQYSTTIQLPAASCTDCTLQMIQVMTENPAAPTNYYSCADFSLVSGGAPSPTPAPSASPSPTATPVPSETPATDSCH